MSDRGRDFVDRHSPYRGTTFLIHYRLGDLENDTHDHRLWIGDAALAKKCRTSPKTIQRAKGLFVLDGFLEELTFTTAPGRPREYRFLFPGETVDILTTVDGGHSRPQRRTKTTRAPLTNQRELKPRLSRAEMILVGEIRDAIRAHGRVRKPTPKEMSCEALEIVGRIGWGRLCGMDDYRLDESVLVAIASATVPGAASQAPERGSLR